MKRLVVVIILWGLGLVSCAAWVEKRESTPPVAADSAVPTVLRMPTATQSGVLGPEPTGIPTLENCQMIQPVENEHILTGKLLYAPGEPMLPYLIDLSSGVEIEFWQGEIGWWSFAVSPDYSRVAYWSKEEDTVRIRIVSSDGAEEKVLGVESEWIGIHSWLDGDRLLVKRWDEGSGLIELVVLEIDSGRWWELPGDYPGRLRWKSADNRWMMRVDIVYDPSLSRALYPVEENDKVGVRLVNAQSGEILTTLHVPDYGKQPQWAPDGSKLALIANLGVGSSGGVGMQDEIFLLGRDGAFRQATHFAEGGRNVHIFTPAWSPDSRFLAFNLRSPSLDFFWSAVLDTVTGAVQEYCGPAGYRALMTYSWSPDGRYFLAVGIDDQTTCGDLWAVDRESGKAYPLRLRGLCLAATVYWLR